MPAIQLVIEELVFVEFMVSDWEREFTYIFVFHFIVFILETTNNTIPTYYYGFHIRTLYPSDK